MTSKRTLITVFALALCFLAANAPAQTGFKLKEILDTGDKAPVPRLLSSVGEFSINNQAQVAFIGDGGLFLRSGNTVSLIAGFGDAAPGGGTFIEISSPSINSQGTNRLCRCGDYCEFRAVPVFAGTNHAARDGWRRLHHW